MHSLFSTRGALFRNSILDHFQTRRRLRISLSTVDNSPPPPPSSLSRGADAGQPPGIGETPLTTRTVPQRRELYPISHDSATRAG